MMNFYIGVAALLSTIILYLLSKRMYRIYKSPFTLPILTTTMTIVVLLLAFQIPYQTYMIGGKWLDQLLGPVVVALAFPLYKQFKLLKTYIIPILTGVFVGSIIGICSGLLLVKWMNFEEMIMYSISAKSVTTPVAMDITQSLGGVSSLAAAFVMIAGIGGASLGPLILHYSRIHLPIAKGIGMGTASHAIGTSRAMENSELEGAVSTVSMTVSAIVVAILTPLLIVMIL
ncbi:LrgB family protein [Aquibacillus saliphilus]|uniref:LrgB family protein n=1 Tax=Aquibacillus saliphilus TaxID=1909422 RepID=UPI001CEFEC31|nr:LrgB family protein [Aquibacillus saliphilus]